MSRKSDPSQVKYQDRKLDLWNACSELGKRFINLKTKAQQQEVVGLEEIPTKGLVKVNQNLKQHLLDIQGELSHQVRQGAVHLLTQFTRVKQILYDL